MHDRIVAELKRIEAEQQVRILYAVESGSRAWGFASQDSDYDVRFIYIHPLDWYLTIGERRDVIEYPITDALDVNGWDIRKALQLFRKSNPPLFEWLRSPIVYLEQYSTVQQMRDLASSFFSPQSCLYHYLHLARGNFRDYLRGDMVKIKKYFYVIRPILACKWIEAENSLPPTEFDVLLRTQVNDPDLLASIETLLRRKMAGEELDLEPRIQVINDFLEHEINHYMNYVETIKRSQPSDQATLDALFRRTLEEVWG